MRRRILAALVLVLALGAAALWVWPVDAYPSLAGTQWRVFELDGRAAEFGARPNLTFAGDAAILGSVVCNGYRGHYRPAYLVPFGPVSITIGSWTKRNCTDGAMEIDSTLARALDRTRRFARASDVLVAYDSRDAAILRFRLQEQIPIE